MFVARGNCPSLFGRDWIQVFYGDNWAGRLTQVNVLETTQKSNQLQVLLEKYDQTVFRPELGELREIKAKLKLKPNAQPKFCKPRPVPYAVKVKLGETLERMVMEGNLEKIDYSEWATLRKPKAAIHFYFVISYSTLQFSIFTSYFLFKNGNFQIFSMPCGICKVPGYARASMLLENE